MSASFFSVMEAVGNGPFSEVAVTQTRLMGVDTHSFSSQPCPIRLNSSGAPAYSCERWLRLCFPPPIGQVTNFRVWSAADVLPDGWQVKFGSTVTYQTPSTSPSAYAHMVLPASDPGPNASNIAGDITVDEYGMLHSPWLVFQAILTGAPADVSDQMLTVSVGWAES